MEIVYLYNMEDENVNNWTCSNKAINKFLSPYNIRQRYKYQLTDYLKEVKNKQDKLENYINNEPYDLTRFIR